jgi:hypothetical protein
MYPHSLLITLSSNYLKAKYIFHQYDVFEYHVKKNQQNFNTLIIIYCINLVKKNNLLYKQFTQQIFSLVN